MTLRQLKLIVTTITLLACLTLPFLVTILRSLYSLDINDSSFEAFQRYQAQLIPSRDLFVYSTLGLCLLVSSWTLINHKRGQSTSRLDWAATFLFILTAAAIIAIKTLLPSGPLI